MRRLVRWSPALSLLFSIVISPALSGLELGPEAMAQADSGSREPITLAVAVAEALAHHDSVVSAREQQTRATLGLSVARSAFLPQVVPNLLGSFGRSDVSSQTYGVNLSQRFLTGTEFRSSLGVTSYQNQLGSFYASDVTLSVSQPLLKGFGRSAVGADIRAAERDLNASVRLVALAERQAALNVAASFYGVLAQQQSVAVAEAGLGRAIKLREASEAKLKAGLVSRLDVLRARQLESDARERLYDARDALEDGVERLLGLMGWRWQASTLVIGELPVLARPVTGEEAVSTALSNRLEIDDARDRLSEATDAVSAAQRDARPQLDVGVALTRRETADTALGSFGVDGFEVVPFVRFSAAENRTLAASGVRTAQVEQQRAVRQFEDLRLKIESEARTSSRQYARALRRAESAGIAIDIAEKEVELAMFRYERGLSNNLDVVTAEGKLFSARAQRLALTAEAAVLQLRLRASMGILDPRMDIR